MPNSLVSLRKAKGLTQQQVGERLAKRLKQPIGASYAQKKIARFESGIARPTDKELHTLAKILRVESDVLRSIIARAPQQAAEIIGQVAATGRSLMATCILARPRPETLEETYSAIRTAIEEGDVWLAIFLPYPRAINLPDPSFHHVSNLLGYYTRVINDVLESTQAFKNLLKKRSNAVALYAPRPELLKHSALLIPPIFRQYSLTVTQTEPPLGPITQSLHVWTPGKEIDTGRPVRATGTYSLRDQIDAWRSFFGEVVQHWIDESKLLSEDDYWTRIDKDR